jgi:hypothetical protein
VFKRKANLAESKEFKELIEQSEDINSDSLRQTKEAIANIKDLADSKTKGKTLQSSLNLNQTGNYLKEGALIAGAAAGVALLSATEAFGAAEDVMILQTAASIEVLAVNTYAQALNLPFIGGSQANSVVATFVTTTKKQHQQHLQAFNSALSNMGQPTQNNPDPVLLKVVMGALPTLQGPLDVVKLAITLENTAAESYVQYVSVLSDVNSKKLMASIMGVEAQHVAVLNAVEALLSNNLVNLIALPPDISHLPSAAGSVGFPNAFYQTNLARPVSEGAVS